MRRCLQCGVQNLEQARFCSNCGNPLFVVRAQSAPAEPALPLPAEPAFKPGPARQENPQQISQQPELQKIQEAPQPVRRESSYPPPWPQSANIARPQDPAQFPSVKPAFSPVSPSPAMQSPFVAQPNNYPGAYAPSHQPAAVPAHNVRPFPAPLPKKKSRTLLFAWAGIVAVILLAIGGLFFWLNSNHQPRLSVIQGRPIPGQQILVQGENFPQGSKITIVVDSGILVSLHPETAWLTQSVLIPVSSTQPEGIIYRAVAANDGTFTVKVRIPAIWKSGSQHTLVAQFLGTDTQKLKSVQYSLTVE